MKNKLLALTAKHLLIHHDKAMACAPLVNSLMRETCSSWGEAEATVDALVQEGKLHAGEVCAGAIATVVVALPNCLPPSARPYVPSIAEEVEEDPFRGEPPSSPSAPPLPKPTLSRRIAFDAPMEEVLPLLVEALHCRLQGGVVYNGDLVDYGIFPSRLRERLEEVNKYLFVYGFAMEDFHHPALQKPIGFRVQLFTPPIGERLDHLANKLIERLREVEEVRIPQSCTHVTSIVCRYAEELRARIAPSYELVREDGALVARKRGALTSTPTMTAIGLTVEEIGQTLRALLATCPYRLLKREQDPAFFDVLVTHAREIERYLPEEFEIHRCGDAVSVQKRRELSAEELQSIKSANGGIR
jgi:hypothetical protein